jgi:hypothetical protein
MKEMQDQLAALEVEGQSGGGLVKAVLSGKGELMRIAIDPSLMKPDEREVLEDLIVAALADGRGKAESVMQERMKDMAGGLPLPPGLKLW